MGRYSITWAMASKTEVQMTIRDMFLEAENVIK
jgi:hypothetical protein